jgi:hypothetical protein
MNLKCLLFGHDTYEVESSICKCGESDILHKDIMKDMPFHGCGNFRPFEIYTRCKREPSRLIKWRKN